ncbi:glyoxalase [Microbacterium sorbitolivorans]|uniref:Glyoxalase n=1 Tax=Microbacterium sorbitolivorans TaxID=1867410 RepID=A0A367Y6R8_9MICO|nr:VOC family protein [Microbacterium sorbitolivorans]RCK61563.1 glyoxalase [Microbacterium sorbitolivorans]GGF31078.1 glyoxalase [Microbacterium sorbitolivorans]
MIFVNLPTTDLERSKAFYTALGCSINPLFTDDNAACIVWDDNTFFMVLTHAHFSQFTSKAIGDGHTTAQAIISFMVDSRDEVDEKITAGLAAGGSEPRDAQDYGFMYQRSIEDPDGNNLEFGYMEPQAAEDGPDAYVAEHGEGPDPVPGV